MAATIKVFKQRLTVEVQGMVPFDMMRYDNCVPDTEGDAHKLERIANDNASAEDRVVNFRRYGATDNVTTGRWASFQCKVVKVEAIT